MIIWSNHEKRRHKNTVSNVDNFDVSAIRNKITEFYFVRKQVPTLRSLLADLRDTLGFTGCRETLRKILLVNGYEFKKNSNGRSLLIEKHEIAAYRHRFLRKIGKLRQEKK